MILRQPYTVKYFIQKEISEFFQDLSWYLVSMTWKFPEIKKNYFGVKILKTKLKMEDLELSSACIILSEHTK